MGKNGKKFQLILSKKDIIKLNELLDEAESYSNKGQFDFDDLIDQESLCSDIICIISKQVRELKKEINK